MNKKTFRKTWQYRLLKVLFFGSYIVFAVTLTLMGIFGSDVQMAGLVWSAVLALVYWFAKRLLYYILFAEPIFLRRKFSNIAEKKK